MHPVTQFVAQLREQADQYAEVGASVDGAKLCRSLAAELEAAWREYELEELTLTTAATALGWEYGRVQKALAAGRLPNVGTKHRPRVRRCDLHGAASLHDSDGPDLAGEVLRSA